MGWLSVLIIVGFIIWIFSALSGLSRGSGSSPSRNTSNRNINHRNYTNISQQIYCSSKNSVPVYKQFTRSGVSNPPASTYTAPSRSVLPPSQSYLRKVFIEVSIDGIVTTLGSIDAIIVPDIGIHKNRKSVLAHLNRLSFDNLAGYDSIKILSEEYDENLIYPYTFDKRLIFFVTCHPLTKELTINSPFYYP